MKKSHKIIIATLLVIVVYVAVNFVSICTFAEIDQKQRADVAIVLGAATYDGEVSPVYQERINHGITLYNDGMVDKIIVTGGVAEGSDISDAWAAKEYAISKGVLAEDILMEETSTITQKNLENSKILMDANGYETAIIVSDPLHMKRAMLLAKDAGITAYSSPTTTTRYVSLATKIPFLCRELFFYVGYKWYRIFR